MKEVWKDIEEYKFKVSTLSWLFSLGESQIRRIINNKSWVKEV